MTKLRKLTRAEIETGGSAMPKIMEYHERLIGQPLTRLARVPADGEYPAYTALEFSVSVLVPQHDDEGNPGDVEWVICGEDGGDAPRKDLGNYNRVPPSLSDLVGHKVTGFGYFHDPSAGFREVIPYILFDNGLAAACWTDDGGGVICHHSDAPEMDLFCQFTLGASGDPA